MVTIIQLENGYHIKSPHHELRCSDVELEGDAVKCKIGVTIVAAYPLNQVAFIFKTAYNNHRIAYVRSEVIGYIHAALRLPHDDLSYDQAEKLYDTYLRDSHYMLEYICDDQMDDEIHQSIHLEHAKRIEDTVYRIHIKNVVRWYVASFNSRYFIRAQPSKLGELQ